MGGTLNSSSFLKSVERAEILADGTIALWEPMPPLPAVMAGHAVAVSGRTVVVTGGYRSGGLLSVKTHVAQIDENGNFTDWVDGPDLSVEHFHHASVATRGSVYVVGGLTGNNSDNTPVVERAIVKEDGTLGAWETLAPLPLKRSHHAMLAIGDYLYVIGGMSGHPAFEHENLKSVLRAKLLADGTIEAWETIGELPVPLGTHAALFHLGNIYLIGGVEGDSANEVNTEKVWRAPVLEDGMLGEWVEDLPLPAPRAHAHHAPFVNGRVYLVGGALNHLSKGDVFVGTFE
jgi:N-acetylneuraminic acid mutarotase